MIDEDSLIVTYESWRGEPRGAKRKSQDWDQRGDCIDCKACVHVCPTGIDIREGLQMECIGCGLCVDACNEIMDEDQSAAESRHLRHPQQSGRPFAAVPPPASG